MPASTDLAAMAWTALEVYRSAPVATVRMALLTRKIWLLAWTGRAAFVFGLIHLSQPRPLSKMARPPTFDMKRNDRRDKGGQTSAKPFFIKKREQGRRHKELTKE
jgi:hypothetical protein